MQGARGDVTSAPLAVTLRINALHPQRESSLSQPATRLGQRCSYLHNTEASATEPTDLLGTDATVAVVPLQVLVTNLVNLTQHVEQ